MLKILASLSVAVLLVATPLAAQAEEEQPLNPKQVEAVRKLVREYLMENPEIIGEALDALREKQMLAAEAEAKKALAERKEEIFNDAEAPVGGNPKGDVTVVEFFDYRCTYCKVVRPALVELLKADGKVKLVYKEFPILGRDSVLASKAALAARNQKKYEEFHDGLMRLRGPINEQAVMTLASELGLNLEKMKKDMEAPEIATALKRNVELARALNVNGTPAWVLGDRVVSGALDPNTMKSMIEQSRKTAPNKS